MVQGRGLLSGALLQRLCADVRREYSWRKRGGVDGSHISLAHHCECRRTRHGVHAHRLAAALQRSFKRQDATAIHPHPRNLAPTLAAAALLPLICPTRDEAPPPRRTRRGRHSAAVSRVLPRLCLAEHLQDALHDRVFAGVVRNVLREAAGEEEEEEEEGGGGRVVADSAHALRQ